MAEENKNITSEQKLWGVLSYIGILSLVALFLKKDPFVHGHAKQGFLIFVGECFMLVPVINFLFGWLIGLVAFVLAIIGIVKVMNGESWKVPFIGEWWDQTLKV